MSSSRYNNGRDSRDYDPRRDGSSYRDSRDRDRRTRERDYDSRSRESDDRRSSSSSVPRRDHPSNQDTFSNRSYSQRDSNRGLKRSVGSKRSWSRSRSRSNSPSRTRSRREDDTNGKGYARKEASSTEWDAQPASPDREEDYEKEIEEQLRMIEEEEDEETKIRKARERRQAMMEQLQKQSAAPPVVSAPAPAPAPVVQPKQEEKPTVSPKVEPIVSEATDEAAKEKEVVDFFNKTPTITTRLGPKNIYLPDLKEEVLDDDEGYYRFIPGDVIGRRYQVFANCGRGVFGSVVKARDLENNDEEVAIKVIRNNEMMKRAGNKEVSILRDIGEQDPQGKYNCIRLLTQLEHQGHLCMVFEPMSMNMREVLQKKRRKDAGLSLEAVRHYGRKLIIALRHLRRCSILHADLKLDNILVNDVNVCKLADFGSASLITENQITPYLVSRFYRAPEIILGLPYDYAIDMWSLGCCLYELYTGRILFAGKTNNDMLRIMMEVKGPFSKKLLRTALFRAQHFDDSFQFLQQTKRLATGPENAGNTLVKIVTILKPSRSIAAEILEVTYSTADRERASQLADLIEKTLALDPQKRITPDEALQHPFFQIIQPQQPHSGTQTQPQPGSGTSTVNV